MLKILRPVVILFFWWILTPSWIFSRMNFCDGESSTSDRTDHCLISKRQKHLHMTNFFTCCRDIASCSRSKQSHLGRCSNGKLRTWTLVSDKTLRSTVELESALSNVNNVKISDLLEFLVMLLLFSLCSYPKIICRNLQD